MFSRNFIPVYKIQKFGLRTSAESHNNVFKKVFTDLDKYRKNLIKNDHALHECFKYIIKLKTLEKKNFLYRCRMWWRKFSLYAF